MKQKKDLIIYFVLIGMLLFSGGKIIQIFIQEKQAQAVNDVPFYPEIQQSYKPEESAAKEPAPPQKSPEEIFDQLRGENENVVAWVYSESTPINHLVMQAQDNTYYLNHLADGTRNAYGSIFLDYRNKSDFSDSYNIIYGHNMRRNAMFGSLKNYESYTYYQEHPFLVLVTESGVYHCEIFSVYQSLETGEAYQCGIVDEGDMEAFLQRSKEQSLYEIPVEVTAQDKIVTFSTCTNVRKQDRWVIMAKMQLQTEETKNIQE